MYRRLLLTGLFAGCMALVLSGCQKPADQSSTAGSETTSPDQAAKSASKAAVAEQPLVIPAETPITVVVDQALGSKTSTTGESFPASIHLPVEVEGRQVIPKGARATGIVRDAKPAGRFKGGAVLSIALTSVTLNGKEYEVHTTAHTQVSKGKGKRTAAMIGGGGAAGALIGGLAGGGKGAAIGAAVGAGAGTGGAALTGDRDIKILAETPVTFKLTQPLEIKR